MNFRSKLSSLGKTWLNKRGYYIVPIQGCMPVKNGGPVINPFTMEGGLRRCMERGIAIETVIDVGASNGCWTRLCKQVFPEARYFLVEAQPCHEPDLIKLKSEDSMIDYILAAAGNRKGTIYFDVSDPFGGAASDVPFEKHCMEVPVIKVDDEVAARALRPPYLLKLDTHGFEIPILEGAFSTLREANLLILEVYNFKISKDCLKFFEMCAYLEQRGFLPIDIVDLMLRIHDDAFWQMDIFFVRNDRKEFSYNAYR